MRSLSRADSSLEDASSSILSSRFIFSYSDFLKLDDFSFSELLAAFLFDYFLSVFLIALVFCVFAFPLPLELPLLFLMVFPAIVLFCLWPSNDLISFSSSNVLLS